MEEFVVYILYSEKYDKIYIGYTSNLIGRFYSHNFYSNKGYTKQYRPWKVLDLELFRVKKEAIIREKSLKTAKGRAYIWKVVISKYRELGFISA